YFIFIPPSATDIYALSLHDALPISPLGGVYAREVADLAEASVAAVQLQGVPGVLGMVTELLAQLEGPEALRVGGGLENLLAGGQHVRDVDVRPEVVVEIGRIDAHREAARVAHRLAR